MLRNLLLSSFACLLLTTGIVIASTHHHYTHSSSTSSTQSTQSAKSTTHTTKRTTHTVRYVRYTHDERGIASWYGPHFNSRITSSGERFNMYSLTAASRTLPLLSHAVVTNLQNGRQVVVKINDRGPFVGHRIIDLSYEAAKKLGMVGEGLARVDVKSISS
jgi:rare lipoprotein A (peptidoglycan hydrolase)